MSYCGPTLSQAPALLSYSCCNSKTKPFQFWFPKALGPGQVLVPKIKLQISPISLPELSNQAFSSGSVTASVISWLAELATRSPTSVESKHEPSPFGVKSRKILLSPPVQPFFVMALVISA